MPQENPSLWFGALESALIFFAILACIGVSFLMGE